ncbi:3-oxoacyl-[acyl-carrier-protein] synthase, mitochondrial [Sitodiplosis mosellana]|uniref:3-oxoacyl-[acyl-carrier-protein] synthase, mitochondrial n=1 Tax=Sitodiplosis mosellana TaxID=263140 RepID=UPI002444E62A|nr:3-oxoacyl-[acyl-carrier-protein] synthase, mitochondrial [Sitodiplosis mosellana]
MLYTLIYKTTRTTFKYLQLQSIRECTTISHANTQRRRVVVTGVGLVSPVGCTVKSAWRNILNGFCGVKKLHDREYDSLPCKIAAKIDEEDLKLHEHFSKTELRAIAPATQLALIAAKQALNMAKWEPKTDLDRTGVAVGMGMVDLSSVCETFEALQNKGYSRVSPHFVPKILANMAAGQISIKYGFQGPNHSVSTACATGAHAIGDSMRFIRNSDADVMVCGGTESNITPLSIAGFCRIRALASNYNDKPLKASRPFDRDRNGFVMGEGAGILVLEELEHAKRRNATIFAEILGYGLSADASHITSPHPEGRGALLAMKNALRDAQISANVVDYVNAHATSTPIGDAIEMNAIQQLFQGNAKNIHVSSTKGHHGHLLGAAGNLETIFTVLACKEAKIPPTLNLDNIPNNSQFINFVRDKPMDWKHSDVNQPRIALKNAFGFGGTNACLCISSFSDILDNN